jgi:hypothetical protein
MKSAREIIRAKTVMASILLASMVCFCSCTDLSQTEKYSHKQQQKIKVVVITGGHEFEEKPFFSLFESYDEIEYVEARQEDDSEIFEDINDWNYEAMVLFSMTQNISAKRRENFVKLLERGVGVVALHHSIGAFQDWNEYRRIIGAKFYLKETEENGVKYEVGSYKHDVDFKVYVKDSEHPITNGISDFLIHDETYKKCVFEQDNRVLLTTDHPTSDEPLCWVRNYAKARVCYIQIGHGPGVYDDTNYQRLVLQAIKWCAAKED